MSLGLLDVRRRVERAGDRAGVLLLPALRTVVWVVVDVADPALETVATVTSPPTKSAVSAPAVTGSS
jgi:hypothetical protein